MLAMIPILVMVGLVFDVGWAYFTTESARTAAQAAAMAAAQSALDIVKAGGTYTCGSTGGSESIGCQSATACASTVPSSFSSNLQNGCVYAISNGFTNGGLSGRQAVTIAANTTSPPPTVPGVNVSYWASVYITQQNPLTFLAVLGGQTLNVGVRATAAVIPVVQQDCLTVLDPRNQNGALTISGGAKVTATACATQVESSSSNAANISGGSTLVSSAVNIVGNTNCPSCITPTPTTGVAAFTDPYAGLVAPTFTASQCDYTNYKPTTGTTLTQGNYCNGITVQGGATVTFSSGTYILIGGGLTVSGGSTVTGSGVTFYNTYNTTHPYNYQYKAINISSSTATLSAPTTGSLSGILFFQDRSASPNGQETFSGGSNVNLTGVLYFPDAGTQLVFSGGSGGSTANTIIDAYDVTFSGASYLGSSTGGSGGPSSPKAALIE